MTATMGSRPVSKDAADRWAEVEAVEAMLLHRLGQGDDSARADLITGRLSFVAARARAFASGRLLDHRDDLQGEAVLALVREVTYLDAARYGDDPTGFSIHLRHRINTAMGDYIRRNVNYGAVPVSANVQRRISHCIELRDRLWRELQREPSAEEVHGAATRPVGAAKDVARYLGKVATVTVEVWMRPWDSVVGTRCTRCTPRSCLKRLKTSSPWIMAMTSLKPPLPLDELDSGSSFQPRFSA